MPTYALYYFEEAHRIHPDLKVAKKVAMLHGRIRASCCDGSQGYVQAAPKWVRQPASVCYGAVVWRHVRNDVMAHAAGMQLTTQAVDGDTSSMKTIRYPVERKCTGTDPVCCIQYTYYVHTMHTLHSLHTIENRDKTTGKEATQ